VAQAESEEALTVPFPAQVLALEAMGTRFELVLPEDGAGDVRAAGEAALAEIEDCHRLLSRFESSSLVSHILRTAALHSVPLDRDTFALFQDAVQVWRLSEGAFDPTVPHRAMEALALNERTATLTLTRPLPSFDLGGIAKGHALELAARVLRDHGVGSAFLHGGTSSALGIGAPPGASGWRVAIAGGGEIDLRDSALAVSAVWNGNPHPTLDPRTGDAVPGPRRAVAVGPNARMADAWSTAALVLGRAPSGLGSEWRIAVSYPEEITAQAAEHRSWR
jgi:thiamine biosynthesis lipoprotein